MTLGERLLKYCKDNDFSASGLYRKVLGINSTVQQAIIDNDLYSSLTAKRIADKLGPEFEQYIVLNECVNCGKKFVGKLNTRCCSSECSKVYTKTKGNERWRNESPTKNENGNTLQEVFVNYLEEKDMSYRIIANEIRVSHQTLNNIRLYNNYSDYTAKLLADHLGGLFETFPIRRNCTVCGNFYYSSHKSSIRCPKCSNSRLKARKKVKEELGIKRKPDKGISETALLAKESEKTYGYYVAMERLSQGR